MGSAAVSGRFDSEMSDEISDLIDGISMAIDNREFTEADSATNAWSAGSK